MGAGRGGPVASSQSPAAAAVSVAPGPPGTTTPPPEPRPAGAGCGCVSAPTSGAPAPAEKATVADAKDFQGIEGVEATVQDGDIHLTIANSLLFDSGKTSLKDTSKKSLDKVASTIREKYGTREILVVGYTDSDPIRRSTYSSNYHLGFERAYSVRGYLDHKGVTGSHMGLVSFGPDRPDGSKEKSRRVEVIVTSKSATSNDGATAGIESPRNTPAAADKVAAPKSTTSAAAARSTGSKSAASTSSVRKASTGRTASSTASGSTTPGSTASGK